MRSTMRPQQPRSKGEMRGFFAALRMTNLLLSSLLLCFVPISAQTPRPTFEVATVKPAPPEADPKSGSWSAPGTGRFTATHVSLALLIQLAYGIDDSQIVSKLGWLETNLYDVAAKPEDGVVSPATSSSLGCRICCSSASTWWRTARRA